MNRRTFLTAVGATATAGLTPQEVTGTTTVSYPRLATLDSNPDWGVNGKWRNQTRIERYGYTLVDATAASTLYEHIGLRNRIADLTNNQFDRIVVPLLATRINLDSYLNYFIDADQVADHLTTQFKEGLETKEFTNIQATAPTGVTPNADSVHEYTATIPLDEHPTAGTQVPRELRAAMNRGRIPVRVVLGVWKPTAGTAYLGAYGYPTISLGDNGPNKHDLRQQLTAYVNALDRR